jgi:hypothetical protein
MNVTYKEDPREWRKTAWLTAVGLAVFSSLLKWRHHLSGTLWKVALGILAAVVIAAVWRPRWFRGYYRFSQKLGFHLSQYIGRIALAVFFGAVLSPIGMVCRAFGYDPLRLKRPPAEATCWKSSKPPTPLDRLF